MNASDFNRFDEPTRRRFITNAAKMYLGVQLMPFFNGAATAAPAAAKEAVKAKAKSVIYLYMSGGMSHLDTFDPKPKKKEVMGPTEAIPTKATDIFVGKNLPKTAEVMDKVCVINSMTSRQGAHEQGTYIMHTSYDMRGTVKHPSLGAWVMKLGGRHNPEIPGYVAIDSSQEYSGGGFFGAKYAAAPIGSPNEGLQDSKKPGDVSKKDFESRLSLADRLNKQFHGKYQNADVKAYEELYLEAIKLMNSKDLKAFNINDESASVRSMYGEGRFAQGCMLARRLVEHGVRFVEVQLGGWDTHFDNFAAVEGRCKEFDQAYAGLLNDLEKKGLLKDTLVVVATEFGRTPTIKTEHQNGRDHHPAAFTCLLAGGGVKGGFKYGESDAKGERVKDKPVAVQDFNATIASALGLPHDLTVMSPSGRPFKFADKGVPVAEVFA
ncbi:DUF1501 domain-containing protein [Luteolibacter arcticus]|uniref:DUF1501 domain-containing protein n=1 Tax=Luteolibacter arcticus TaxID=1581411 RepID=A0ABT3GKK2_9BACT|nr:DUF1501 domain-containing protein [Luteolibacter arcticus]MCW1924053.1 DUF1501 domain-containing protein [Luteolibacter arcticus]